MKLFVADIGGIPVSARGFEDLEAARSYFDEQSLREAIQEKSRCIRYANYENLVALRQPK